MKMKMMKPTHGPIQEKDHCNGNAYHYRPKEEQEKTHLLLMCRWFPFFTHTCT
jgi:hypothetical protein